MNLERSLVKAAEDRATEAEAQATASANELARTEDAIRALVRQGKPKVWHRQAAGATQDYRYLKKFS